MGQVPLYLDCCLEQHSTASGPSASTADGGEVLGSVRSHKLSDTNPETRGLGVFCFCVRLFEIR